MIKQFTVGAVAGAMLLASGLAYAAEATGAIRTWNEQNRQLTLDNGQTYILQANVPLTGIQLTPGQRVTLTFDAQGNQNMVTRIVPAAGAAPGGAGGAAPGGAGAAPGGAGGGAGGAGGAGGPGGM